MALMPVVTREMSVLARRQSTYWSRALTAIIAVLTMIWLLLVGASRVSMAELGRSIFGILSGFCFVFALLVGMQATADSVSEEKREGTLGLLFLTDLRGIHIVLGKMAASSLNAVFAVLGVVPMLSLALLLGGVTLRQVGLVAIILLNSMFLSLSLGLFVSTLSKNERKAMFACFVGLFIITLMPFVVSAAISDLTKKIDEEIAWISPIYSFLCLQATPGSGFNTAFLVPSLIFQHILAWLFLFLASRILPRCIHELPARRFLRWRAMLDNYVFGKREQRKRYRAALLDRNAFLWLASRERIKPRYAWTIVAFFALLFLWVAALFPTIFFDPPVPITIIFLVHFIFKLWTTSEVCSRLINDRRSGALELLLSSPLDVPEIAEGQSLALKRIFRRPVSVIVAAEIAIMAASLHESRQAEPLDTILLYVGTASTLLLDLWALKWVGLWLSLFGKSIERVLISTVSRVLGIPTLIFALIAGTLASIVALQNEQIPTAVFLALWSLISVVFSASFGLSAKRNFLRHCRQIAAEPFDARTFKPGKSKAQKTARAKEPLWRLTSAAMRRHWVLTGSTVVLAITILGPFCRQLYWKHQLSLELRHIRSKHQPAGIAEIGRVYPPLPAAENAFALLRNTGMVNRRLRYVAQAQWFAGVKTNRTATLAECQQVVTNNAAQLAALRELPAYQQAYLDPQDSTSWIIPGDVPGYITLSMADIVMAAEQQDHRRLHSDFQCVLAIIRLLRAQPLATLQVECAQTLQTLGHSLEFIFASAPLPADVLLDLQLLLEKIENPSALPRTLSVERALLIDSWGQPDARFSTGPPILISAGHGLLDAVGSYDQRLVQILRGFESARNAAFEPRPKLLREASLSLLGAPPPPAAWTVSYHPDFYSIIYNDTLISARLELLRAALAAARYQFERGCFPQNLQQLAPQFLDRPPIDPFTGDPLQSELTRGILLIHSPQRFVGNSSDALSFRVPAISESRKSQ